MADYADAISGKTYAPREYLEHQLEMDDDEKAARQTFFEELFAKHESEKVTA